MSLVWHIVRKDLRRLAVPVGLWLAFIAGSAIWFRMSTVADGPAAAGAAVMWIAMMSIWKNFLIGGHYVVGFLLTGALIVEDTLVGPSEFWMTRPISGTRLLAAKLLAAAILFVIAPALALGAVWLTMGFGPLQILVAAGKLSLMSCGFALLALSIASLAGSLAQFLGFSVGLLAASFGASILAALLARMTVATLHETRELLVEVVVLAALAAVLVQQFMVRRPARGWALIGVALVASLPIRVGWPWDVSGSLLAREREQSSAAPEDRDVKLTVERITLDHFGTKMLQANLWVAMTPSTRGDGLFYAPARGYGTINLPGGSGYELDLQHGGGWGEDAALETLLAEPPPAMRWTVYGMARRPVAATKVEARVVGKLEVWLERCRVLGELPSRVGGELSNGPSHTRVIAIESPPTWDKTLVIDERDAQIDDVNNSSSASVRRNEFSGGRCDIFVLWNRAAHQAEVIRYDELGWTKMNAQIAAFRRLYLPQHDHDDWRTDAVIVKVRLEREGRFWRDFEAQATIDTTERGP